MEPKPEFVSDVFSYVFPTFTIAPAANQTQQVVIQADSAFECFSIAFHADIAVAAFVWNTRPIPNVTLILQDTGSGRNLMNGAVPLSAIAGIAEQPAYLPQPKTFNPLAAIQATLTNFDAAVTYNIRLTLNGRKIYNLSS